MQTRCRKAVAAIALMACFGSSWGQQDNPQTCGGTRSVYFGNGVGTTDTDDAAESFKEVIPSLRATIPGPSRNTRYSLAFNRSAGKVSDVIESARQILGNEYPSLLMGYLLRAGGVPDFIIPPSLRLALEDALRSDWARRLIQGTASASDVALQVQNYRADIQRGRKVVVIAHSQGNIFSNLAFEGLTNQERASFAMVPVASPDSVIKKSLVGHVTFAEDLVIDLVQLLRVASGLPLAPLPNDFGIQGGTRLGHYFSEDYLADTSAKAFIVDGVFQSLSQVSMPLGTICGASDQVTFLVSGIIASASDGDVPGALAKKFPRGYSVGSPVVFEYSFQATQPDLLPQFGNAGSYLVNSGAITVGSNPSERVFRDPADSVGEAARIYVENSANGANNSDLYSVFLSDQSPFFSPCTATWNFVLVLASTRDWLTGDQLPTASIDVSFFQQSPDVRAMSLFLRPNGLCSGELGAELLVLITSVVKR